jgi:hypothetical protein
MKRSLRTSLFILVRVLAGFVIFMVWINGIAFTVSHFLGNGCQ